MLSSNGDYPMTSTTDFSKKRLTTILSALDDAPRSPANKGEALRAIGRSARRFGLTAEDVLAAAPGLLDGRLSPADFRVELHDLGSAPVQATAAPQGTPEAQDEATAGQEPQPPAEPAQATEAPAASKRKAKARAKAAKSAKPAKAASDDKPTPRTGTKQAKLIELLKRPEGATVDHIAAATGWQKHTIRGAISGALKKKLGLKVEATRTREVGPNKTGAKGSATVYRIVG
jgi:nucleoid-associated protein YgaU